MTCCQPTPCMAQRSRCLSFQKYLGTCLRRWFFLVAVIRFDAMQTSDNCISSHKLCVCVCVTKTVQDPRAPRALGREYDLEFPKEDLQAGGFHTNLVTLRMTLWGLWVLSWSSALLQLGDSHPPPGVCQDSFATHPWSRGLTRRSEGKDRNTEEGI